MGPRIGGAQGVWGPDVTLGDSVADHRSWAEEGAVPTSEAERELTEMVHGKGLAPSQAGRGFPVTGLGVHHTNEEVGPGFRAGQQSQAGV